VQCSETMPNNYTLYYCPTQSTLVMWCLLGLGDQLFLS
jgi:hypothetical protein